MSRPDPTAQPLGRSTRLALVGWAVALVALLGVARWLQPDPKGFGTHTQLGLWPCAFRATTGRPCPTCGMTTAFAWFTRGEWGQSWRANPAGFLLVPTCIALIPWTVAVAARGRAFGSRTLETPLIYLAVATVALTVISWSVRLVIGGR
ncbi:DUF2752 domain-containing protein [Tundrisphaera sp. TA3]|uniref:DUF2752 domain-containing protein n=1 Tax=Tundrisphaera sp. TA3 TaxID=3435775 RepID=UPI003EC022F3